MGTSKSFVLFTHPIPVDKYHWYELGIGVYLSGRKACWYDVFGYVYKMWHARNGWIMLTLFLCVLNYIMVKVVRLEMISIFITPSHSVYTLTVYKWLTK